MFIAASYHVPLHKKGPSHPIKAKAQFDTFDEAIAYAIAHVKHNGTTHAADEVQGEFGNIMYVHGSGHAMRMVVFEERDYVMMWQWLIGDIMQAKGYRHTLCVPMKPI